MNTGKIGQFYYPNSPIIKPSSPTHSNVGQANVRPFPVKDTAFAHVLNQTLAKESLKFSQHAQNRLNERGIQLTVEQIERLEQGLVKAKNKGARESLFLMEDLAFVVSVKNQTVITAMEKEQMSEQVVTNIDSAVLL